MTNPIEFSDSAARHNLQYLFVAQAQKESTVNEALARIDSLLHPSVIGVADNPPASPAVGESWIVGAAPTGDWTDYSNNLAYWMGDAWLFSTPMEGMRVFSLADGCELLFSTNWQKNDPISDPSAGSVVDTEARATIVAILQALRTNGIVPTA